MDRTIIPAMTLFLLSLFFRMEAQVSLPDNMVVADCSTGVEAMTWGVHIDWSSANNLVCNLNIPLVGDLDGDGHPDILCFSLAGQLPSNYGNNNNQMLVFDGVTKQLKATITMESPVSAFDAAAYGLVRTANGKGLIVVACIDYKLRAYDITSPTPNTPYWVSDVNYGTGTNNYAVNVSFADFNGDGHPEVYVKNKIFNAENGKLLAEAATTNTGNSFAHWTHYTHRKLSAPMAADICGDARPELILGNEIYEASITNTNGTAGNSLTLVKQTAPPTGVPADGHSQVADFNLDGHPDVFISIRTTDMHQGTVYCYVWDVFNQTVSNPLTIPTSFSGKSIPLIADIDSDGALEIVIQNGSTDTYNRIQAYKYNAATQSFSMMWGLHPDEDSFSNSFTAFDFNQDGLLELVICDQSTLRIVNGSGKSHITHNDTVPVYVLNSFPFSETTIMQYPVIADADADAAAEIVSVGSTKLNILKSSGLPWAPARPVWNQYMYNVTNINKDLSVPTTVFNNATPFTDPSGVVRRPFNNFLQQATTLDHYGRPFVPLTNISITQAPVITYDEEDNLQVVVTACNTGSFLFSSPLHIATYTASGELLQTEEQDYDLAPGDCITMTLTYPASVISQFTNPIPLRIVFNDQGNGLAQYGGLQTECDTSDNSCTVDGRPCEIMLPNVITPNNDGFNDAFEPQLEGDFLNLKMTIYNRWGRKVYEQESSHDLLWNAEDVADGVYYCVIEYQCVVEGKKKKGINTSITVIR